MCAYDRIGRGRKFQIRGAQFEKQTEPDVVRGRNGTGVKQDWFAPVLWDRFLRFSFLQMTCEAVPLSLKYANEQAQKTVHLVFSFAHRKSALSPGRTEQCKPRPTWLRVAIVTCEACVQRTENVNWFEALYDGAVDVITAASARSRPSNQLMMIFIYVKDSPTGTKPWSRGSP